MAVLRMDLKKYARYRKALADRFLPAAMRGALSAAHRGRVVLERRTREAPAANPGGVGAGGAVDTGEFVRRWQAEATSYGARVFNDSPYGPVIEYGRRPGGKMPPVDAIARWAQRRLQISEGEARGVAFAIARAIADRGLVGRKIAEGAVDELATIAGEEIRRELDVETGRAA